MPDYASAGAAAAAGAAALTGGIINFKGFKDDNKTNLQQVRETNKSNQELAQYAWNNDVAMWHMQNAYNSPAAQMVRFKAAGLNPNLIYSQGNAGNATNMPTYNAPTLQAGHVQPTPALIDVAGILESVEKGLNALEGHEQLVNQNALSQAQATAARAQANKSVTDQIESLERAASTKQQREQAGQLFNYSLEAARLNNQSMVEQILSQQQNNSLFDLRRQEYSLKNQLLQSNIVKTDNEAQKILSDIDVNAAKIVNLAASTDQLKALASRTYNETLFLEGTMETRKQMVAQELTNEILNGNIKVHEGRLVEAKVGETNERTRGQWQMNKYYGRFGYSKSPLGSAIGDGITILSGGL